MSYGRLRCLRCGDTDPQNIFAFLGRIGCRACGLEMEVSKWCVWVDVDEIISERENDRTLSQV